MTRRGRWYTRRGRGRGRLPPRPSISLWTNGSACPPPLDTGLRRNDGGYAGAGSRCRGTGESRLAPTMEAAGAALVAAPTISLRVNGLPSTSPLDSCPRIEVGGRLRRNDGGYAGAGSRCRGTGESRLAPTMEAAGAALVAAPTISLRVNGLPSTSPLDSCPRIEVRGRLRRNDGGYAGAGSRCRGTGESRLAPTMEAAGAALVAAPTISLRVNGLPSTSPLDSCPRIEVGGRLRRNDGGYAGAGSRCRGTGESRLAPTMEAAGAALVAAPTISLRVNGLPSTSPLDSCPRIEVRGRLRRNDGGYAGAGSRCRGTGESRLVPTHTCPLSAGPGAGAACPSGSGGSRR